MLKENIPGFNLQRGLRSVQGNSALYEKLLKKFHQQCLNAATELDTCLAAGKIKESMHVVHSIKGVSASLGAETLYETSQHLEIALHKNSTEIIACKKEFDAALKTVIDGLSEIAEHAV